MIVALLGTLVALELTARAYVYGIAKRSKLFRPDSLLGWSVIPGLDVERRNSDGRPWRIATNELGLRGPATWNPSAGRRVLVLGDSFAFGEGVDIEQRFDTLVSRDHPEWSLINLGVMGYGTDQQVIGARRYQLELGEGDSLILLTYGNDFADLLRKTHSGRKKPWFTLESGRLVEHSPDLGWSQHLRDSSYLAAFVLSNMDRLDEPTQAELASGAELYRAIVLELRDELAGRGVNLLIVHHGDRVLPEAELPAFYDGLCREPGLVCTALDAPMAEAAESSFLSDGHWSAQGHRQVAAILSEVLEQTATP